MKKPGNIALAVIARYAILLATVGHAEDVTVAAGVPPTVNVSQKQILDDEPCLREISRTRGATARQALPPKKTQRGPQSVQEYEGKAGQHP
jgi:hypothetical protein